VKDDRPYFDGKGNEQIKIKCQRAKKVVQEFLEHEEKV